MHWQCCSEGPWDIPCLPCSWLVGLLPWGVLCDCLQYWYFFWSGKGMQLLIWTDLWKLTFSVCKLMWPTHPVVVWKMSVRLVGANVPVWRNISLALSPLVTLIWLAKGQLIFDSLCSIADLGMAPQSFKHLWLLVLHREPQCVPIVWVIVTVVFFSLFSWF